MLLHMQIWLLFTAYRNLAPSPTPYDLPFSHNTARLTQQSA